ncbi:hypothetical protein F0U59_07970 [Archangium gephyra]|nr:hypothetical protein F0U59_07970 [Archangium gephyra]
MKIHIAVLTILVGVVVGCGGTTELEERDMLGENTQALCSVSASCTYAPTTISCSGNTCAAQNGSYVTCDGVTTYCTPPPCSAGIICTQLKQFACNPGDEAECCGSPGYNPQSCFCNPRELWLCN